MLLLGKYLQLSLKKVSQFTRKIFRSYWISKNELESSQGGYNLSLGDPSLGEGNLELANAPINPFHHHIDAAYDGSMYYQLSNLFYLCPGQQATTCSASSTRICKTTADYRKYHSPLDRHRSKDSEA